MSTDPTPDLTEAQKAYNVAHSEMFQLAAYGHHPSGEALTDEGKRQQRDYNNRIQKAREQLEAALLRLVAERAESFRGDWGIPAAWLRSLADDPAEVSLLAVAPEELEEAGLTPVSPPPATDRAVWREAAVFVEAMNEACDNRRPCESCTTREDVASELRRLAAGERDEQQARQDGAETRCPNREPLIGVQCSKQADHEGAHSDQPGRIWYPAPAEETHIVADDSDDPEHIDDCPGCEAFTLAGHVAAAPVAGQPPADTTGEEAQS